MTNNLRLVLIANFLFLLLSIGSFNAQAIEQKIDSLKKQLEMAKEDITRLNILNDLSQELINISEYEKSMKYANEVIALCKKLLNNKILLIPKFKILEKKATAYNNIGVIYYYLGNYDKALEYYFVSLKIKEEIGDKKGIAFSYHNIATIFYKQGFYDKALENYTTSLKLKKETGDKKGIAFSYHNIGTIYYKQGCFEKALNNYFVSLKIKEEIGNKQDIAESYINIGIIYKVQADQKQNQDSIVYRNQLYKKALDFFLVSLKIREQFNEKYQIITCYINLGATYIALKDFESARKYLDKGLILAKEIKDKDGIKECYGELTQLYFTILNWKDAFKYHKLYTQMKDSIFNETSTKAIAEMQTKYETEKKEKEIEVLTKDNELKALQAKQQDDQIKKQWLLIIGIVFILGLAFSLMYVIYSQFKFKKTANEELELKNRVMAEINKDLDKKNKSVADSINYAQRIQETIMPTQNQLQKLFPESFIFYKAKDVVSGDFPWVWSSNGSNDGIFVSAVDCTGHGVPGAMMSMIGYFLLNEIVNDRKIKMPSEILNHLHEGIKQTLRQEENLESKDGMDIALCTIRKDKMEAQFAGAHRPMLLLHKGEIIEVKGNRFPIGGLQYSSRGKEIKFTNHILKLEKGDSIYFYSDGLVDQLGGESGKRFKNNQVKKIILENQHKTMQEIHDVLNEEFIKWMGNEKQLDDVLMVGIRM